jgi:hypothetical protein
VGERPNPLVLVLAFELEDEVEESEGAAEEVERLAQPRWRSVILEISSDDESLAVGLGIVSSRLISLKVEKNQARPAENPMRGRLLRHALGLSLVTTPLEGWMPTLTVESFSFSLVIRSTWITQQRRYTCTTLPGLKLVPVVVLRPVARPQALRSEGADARRPPPPAPRLEQRGRLGLSQTGKSYSLVWILCSCNFILDSSSGRHAGFRRRRSFRRPRALMGMMRRTW